MIGSNTTRSQEEYAVAQKIIKLLIAKGIVRSESGMDQYIKDWNLVFEILDLTKEG